ncbi:hypothetical protein L861_12060 [Litchfieldella anticariensis FP35 = DSM 16096]|uniref:Neutral metalloproteinase n=1 Tax=Litchfieldella anticariensis (strain DSM 16096 / CECT 5854 / CIP 108499 / LMG 22089 / FP35) TaxID=1121939 RepID=S2L987_LITA3|nr:M4 family metallopeptidase [Halomonas anticariensis]EPC01301.1 hypothetical protein L861_12060 [Halomonas anticariensis FP35 = DSM 16096]
MPNTSRSHAPRRFMPPYILERIASKGSDRLRDCAQHTLVDDRHFRARPGGASLPPVSPQPGQSVRYIYSAERQRRLPGVLVRSEGEGDSGDLAVDEAYRWLGATYRFFWEVLERHSIDDRGMALLGTVHYGQDYENAFWDGTQMVFGDGDGELFNRFTIALEIVAHEMAHGVIEREARLEYFSQAGALNESLADVFGSLVKQYERGETAEQADWLIGEGLFTDQVTGRALRSMAEPGSAYDDPILGRDPQPRHMDNYVLTEEDNGGVHINSGIPNRAFYLAAMALGGHAWEHLGRVWYDTLLDQRLGQQSDFATFAGLTLDNTLRRFGASSPESHAVRDAWRDVGIQP